VKDEPIYVSRNTVKSLWQEYRIYTDRVEFDTHFGKMTIPFDHIETIDISESEVEGLLRGDLHLKDFRPALKIDWANFVEHVVLDKSQGLVKRVLFTPDDVHAFKRAMDDALARYRSERAGGR
jgi:hypothetical protein